MKDMNIKFNESNSLVEKIFLNNYKNILLVSINLCHVA